MHAQTTRDDSDPAAGPKSGHFFSHACQARGFSAPTWNSSPCIPVMLECQPLTQRALLRIQPAIPSDTVACSVVQTPMMTAEAVTVSPFNHVHVLM